MRKEHGDNAVDFEMIICYNEKISAPPSVHLGRGAQKNYPFVYRHRAMYPLLLVYRPIKGAIKRPKELIDEYRKVKNLKERDY